MVSSIDLSCNDSKAFALVLCVEKKPITQGKSLQISIIFMTLNCSTYSNFYVHN